MNACVVFWRFTVKEEDTILIGSNFVALYLATLNMDE